MCGNAGARASRDWGFGKPFCTMVIFVPSAPSLTNVASTFLLCLVSPGRNKVDVNAICRGRSISMKWFSSRYGWWGAPPTIVQSRPPAGRRRNRLLMRSRGPGWCKRQTPLLGRHSELARPGDHTLAHSSRSFSCELNCGLTARPKAVPVPPVIMCIASYGSAEAGISVHTE